MARFTAIGSVAVLAAFAFFGAYPASADAPDDPFCIITPEAVGKAAPDFTSFAAPVEKIGRPAPLDLASDPLARQFQTAIRNAMQNGPNFAGHYAIATWGCGTACQDWAIVDVKTGRVHAEPTLRPIGVMSGVGLIFRRDSKLLAILGAPHEEPARDGASFYVWQDGALKLKKFVPKRNACSSR